MNAEFIERHSALSLAPVPDDDASDDPVSGDDIAMADIMRADAIHRALRDPRHASLIDPSISLEEQIARFDAALFGG